MKTSLAVSGLALLLGLAVALPQAAAQMASPKPESVKAGSYKIDPYHSQIEFTLAHLGFTEFSGFFQPDSGSLQIDPAHPEAAKLEVNIPVESIVAPAGAATTKLVDELKGEQWFDAAKFPSATFTSTKIVAAGKDKAIVTGNLTLHGVTKPVVLNVRFIGAGVNPISKAYTVGFEAKGAIKRSDFGVKQYVPVLGDEVQLRIAGGFELQQ